MRATVREPNVEIFILRCAQLGLHTDDLDDLTIGTVYDMLIEQANDREEWPVKATQQDIKEVFG